MASTGGVQGSGAGQSIAQINSDTADSAALAEAKRNQVNQETVNSAKSKGSAAIKGALD